MSKKDKSSHESLFFKKKYRRLFIRIILVSLVGAFLYIFFNPSVIENPERQAQIESLRSSILSLNDQGQEQLVHAIPQLKKITDSVISLGKQGVILGDQEVYIEDLFSQLTDSIEKLPASQIKKLKADFCADVIESAVYQATQSALIH